MIDGVGLMAVLRRNGRNGVRPRQVSAAAARLGHVTCGARASTAPTRRGRPESPAPPCSLLTASAACRLPD